MFPLRVSLHYLHNLKKVLTLHNKTGFQVFIMFDYKNRMTKCDLSTLEFLSIEHSPPGSFEGPCKMLV